MKRKAGFKVSGFQNFKDVAVPVASILLVP